jgi:hypothetical protein
MMICTPPPGSLVTVTARFPSFCRGCSSALAVPGFGPNRAHIAVAANEQRHEELNTLIVDPPSSKGTGGLARAVQETAIKTRTTGSTVKPFGITAAEVILPLLVSAAQKVQFDRRNCQNAGSCPRHACRDLSAANRPMPRGFVVLSGGKLQE